MKGGADHILSLHEKQITEVFLRTGYKLVVTGHSLGAGTATLIAMILKQKGHACQAYGFATPANVESSAAAGTSDYVTTVIMGDDVIPRASPLALRELVLRIHGLPWADMAEGDWIEERLTKDMGSLAGKALVGVTRTQMRAIAKEDALEKATSAKLTSMSPAGLLIHLYDREWTNRGLIPESKSDQLAKKYAAAVVPNDSPLLRVEITGRMMEDHSFGPTSKEDPVKKRGAYQVAVNNLCQGTLPPVPPRR
jgi:hypothetical protein